MFTVLDLAKAKTESRKLVMVTCYDYSFAKIVDRAGIDLVLVGDSVAMVMHGHPSTVHADVEMLETHTRAVARGLSHPFLIADMPFLSLSQGIDFALSSAGRLLRAGAHAVKIENVRGFESAIELMVRSGIPVVGHLGLTPQSVNVFGGMKVQAKSEEAQAALLADAQAFEALGACALVLECVPSGVARAVTRALGIPTIGIGAGADVDGQVLVLQDLLGFSDEFKPKFLKQFLDGGAQIRGALERFADEVRTGAYPDAEHSYSTGSPKAPVTPRANA